MKRKISFLTLILIFTISLPACTSTRFSGSRTGNENELIMDYTIFNTTDSQELQLEKDDIVKIEVISKSGNVDISLRKADESPIYEETNIPTSTFQITIDESGTYTVSVAGKKAKGSVKITKEEFSSHL